MNPTSFDESNHVLGAPKGMSADECLPLSVCMTSNGQHDVVVSCWKVTAEELEEIKKTGRVWLIVCGKTMPPVWLNGTSPFVHGGK